MAEIAFSSITDALTLGIREVFPDANIFTETPVQDVQPGAFTVRSLPVSQEHDSGMWWKDNHGPALGARFRRNALAEVKYFPKSIPGELECEAVKEQLIWVMQLIQTLEGDYLSGRRVQGVISDGVLVMTAAYPHFVRIDQPQQTMENLHFNGGGIMDED